MTGKETVSVTVTVTVPSAPALKDFVIEVVGLVELPDGNIGLGTAEPVKIGPDGMDGVRCADELSETDEDDEEG